MKRTKITICGIVGALFLISIFPVVSITAGNAFSIENTSINDKSMEIPGVGENMQLKTSNTPTQSALGEIFNNFINYVLKPIMQQRQIDLHNSMNNYLEPNTFFRFPWYKLIDGYSMEFDGIGDSVGIGIRGFVASYFVSGLDMRFDLSGLEGCIDISGAVPSYYSSGLDMRFDGISNLGDVDLSGLEYLDNFIGGGGEIDPPGGWWAYNYNPAQIAYIGTIC